MSNIKQQNNDAFFADLIGNSLNSTGSNSKGQQKSLNSLGNTNAVTGNERTGAYPYSSANSKTNNVMNGVIPLQNPANVSATPSSASLLSQTGVSSFQNKSNQSNKHIDSSARSIPLGTFAMDPLANKKTNLEHMDNNYNLESSGSASSSKFFVQNPQLSGVDNQKVQSQFDPLSPSMSKINNSKILKTPENNPVIGLNFHAKAASPSPALPLLPQSSAWDQLDHLLNKNTTQGADIFDIDFLASKKAVPKNIEVENDFLAGFREQKVTKPSPAPADIKQVSIERLVAMGFDSETALVALVDSKLDFDEALSALLSGAYKKTENTEYKYPSKDVGDLVSMGFEKNAAISALDSTKNNKSAAIDLLFEHKSRGDSQFSHEQVQILVSAGFDENSARSALKKSKGNTEHAVEILLLQGRFDSGLSDEYSKHEKSSLANAASSLGFSVLKNARTAFSIAKKKVEEVLIEKPKDKIDIQYSRQDWERSVFKDSAIHSTPPETPETKKPYSPGRNSDDSFEIPLERGNLSKVPKSPDIVSTGLLIFEDEPPNPKHNLVTYLSPIKLNTTASPLVEIPSLATPNQLLSSNEYKNSGNDFFKKGQFGDAESMYTKAISALPEKDIFQLPLYNNRAACRLKNGDNRGAVADCDFVLLLSPSDLKALLRRATAYEALESWEMARNDYRKIMGIDSTVKGCSVGLARANAALQPRKEGIPSAVTISSKAMAPVVKQAVDDAVQKLRETNDAQTQLESEKYVASEAVEAKIEAWKKKKETNIRALLSSLEVILWRDCNWKSVGLSELITPAQVKKKYMQAVAKVHPDKLPATCTVEQQLIASSVFTILNEAFDAFRIANN